MDIGNLYFRPIEGSATEFVPSKRSKHVTRKYSVRSFDHKLRYASQGDHARPNWRPIGPKPCRAAWGRSRPRGGNPLETARRAIRQRTRRLSTKLSSPARFFRSFRSLALPILGVTPVPVSNHFSRLASNQSPFTNHESPPRTRVQLSQSLISDHNRRYSAPRPDLECNHQEVLKK